MVTGTPATLLELLFVRAAWSLEAGPWLPAADPPPERGSSQRPDDDVDAEHRWDQLWRQAVLPLKHPSSDDFWGLRYGLGGIDQEAMRTWTADSRLAVSRAATDFHHSPERLLLPELSAAAADGLRRLIVLPLLGEFSTAIAAGALLVSTRTYTDVDRLRSALARREGD